MTCHVSDILDKCSAYSDNKWVSIRYLLRFFLTENRLNVVPHRGAAEAADENITSV